MPSIISGHEYDLFISYRHNDNRSGWVTEFVKALQEELAATIKEPVSVYFDTNPHDGLLETHNVDKSLEGKLKCLVFIPIVSQTYCDPKSFAWQHEFMAFNNASKEDQLGRDVKLGNGNVASRILPVKIHDLDAEDKALLERELGGFLRAIDFIYKEAGVNRPLKPTDSKTDNHNKTDYRNQVNKVANAVKEIITALKSPAASRSAQSTRSSIPAPTPIPSSQKKIAVAAGVLMLLAIISFFLYKTYSPPAPVYFGPKTIAVLPFANLSSNKEDEYFTDGMGNEIFTQLSKIGSLTIISRTTMAQFQDNRKTSKEIGEMTGADVLLEGSVQKSGNKVHISVQLIDATHDKQLWAETYDQEFKDIFSIQTDVAKRVAAKLQANITSSEKALIEKRPTTNLEAYNLYLKGNFEIRKVSPEAVEAGLAMLKKAIQLDPDFALPYIGVAYYYGVVTDFYMPPHDAMPQLKIAAQTALAKDSTLGDAHGLYGMYHAWYAWEWELAEKEAQTAIQLEPNRFWGHLVYSWYFASQGKLDDAIREGARSAELEPMSTEEVSFYALMHYYARQYDDALLVLDKVNTLDPSYPFAHFMRGQCFTRQGKFKEAIAEQKLAHQVFAAPWSHARLAYAYAAGGEKKQALAILDSLKTESRKVYVPSDVVATVYVALGDKDHAFEYLNKAMEERAGWLIWIKVDPLWDPIRDDPRYGEVLKKMKLAR